jgi:ferredoxin
LPDVTTAVAWLGYGLAALVAVSLIIKWRRERQLSNWWTGVVVEGRRLHVRIDHDLCMGATSCVALAPEIFRLDWSKKKSMFEPAPLEKIGDVGADPDKVFFAAQSCPYRAIILEDATDGERIFP